MTDGSPGQSKKDVPLPGSSIPGSSEKRTSAARLRDNDASGIAELLSAAPVVGSVRSMPAPRLVSSIAHRVPAVILDSVRIGDLHVAGASLLGTSHGSAGTVRQDAYNFAATQSGEFVIAVADGLGSRALSQIGATLFCDGVARLAVDMLGPGTQGTAQDLLLAGASYAATTAAQLYELAETDISFVAAVAILGEPEAHGLRTAEIARVGDVTAFVKDEDGHITELFASDDLPINIVGNSFPTTQEVPQITRSGARILAVVTDGLANDIRTSPTVRSWLSACWAEPTGPFAFGDSLRYQRQGSHDDRTAVVVWQRPGFSMPTRTPGT
jgi:hypothetical protein